MAWSRRSFLGLATIAQFGRVVADPAPDRPRADRFRL